MAGSDSEIVHKNRLVQDSFNDTTAYTVVENKKKLEHYNPCPTSHYCFNSSPVRLYRKSFCTTPGIRADISVAVSISKILSFLYDGQGAVRQAILYNDRSS